MSSGVKFSGDVKFKGEPREAIDMDRARAAVLACQEALSVLELLRASVPTAIRSPEAADRCADESC